ncbi:MAG: DUF370 domain-containing protein [Lachnospiraceae bacterium]
MDKLIHIGFGNIVNTGKIIAIVSPDSAPIKRMVQKAKESGMAIDATQGRKTKAVLVMENSQIVLSALLPETIAGRAQVAGCSDTTALEKHDTVCGDAAAEPDDRQSESGEEDE